MGYGYGWVAVKSLLLAAVCFLAVPAVAPADPHVSPQVLLDDVNAYRASLGFPPLVLDDALASSCQKHVDYTFANGGPAQVPDGHDEIPGNPGYTTEGDEAAHASILGYDLLNDSKPFFRAPTHLWFFLHPLGVRAGVAQRTDTVNGQPLTLSCMRIEYSDASGQRRAPRTPPSLWSYPADGATGVSVFLSAAEIPHIPAYQVGLTNDPSAPYLAGEHVLLWHDDVDGEQMNAICRAALIGPGGQPVRAPWQSQLVVPAEPLIPGGSYTTLATMSTMEECGDTQRVGQTSMTTAPRLTDSELVNFFEPFARDGKTFGASEPSETLKLVRGGIKVTYVPGGYSFELDGCWEYRCEWELSNMNPGQSLEVAYTSKQIDLGGSCYGPARIVGLYTKGTDGTTYTRNEVTVTPLGGGECEAPPQVQNAGPKRGASGRVVRITGQELEQATGVSFGGVAATSWKPSSSGLLVTVPTGARSGPVTVSTPTATVRAIARFTVSRKDGVSPDTQVLLGPPPSGSSSTASFAFSATERSSFQCSLDGAKFRKCRSPLRLEGLKVGSHSLKVRATDRAGNADPSPARYSWQVTASG